MKFNFKELNANARLSLIVGGLALINVGSGCSQTANPTAPESVVQAPAAQTQGDSKAESAEQTQARKEILSLCEKLAQDDTSQLRPLYTEEAFRIQCGEWILTAVNLFSMEENIGDLAAMADLKKFVQESKLDELDLDPILADDKSMFGGKIVAEAYEKLPAENRLEIALQCGTLVKAMEKQLTMLDQEAQEDAAEGDQKEKNSSSEQGEENSVGDEPGPLEFFLRGKVQEIIWAENRATLRAGYQLSDFNDDELAEMDLDREDVTELPHPETFLNFVRIDGKWFFDGVDTEKSYASFKEKFGSSQMEDSMPLIENIELKGEAVSGTEIALSDYKGKVVLIDCWGTWCGPCVASLPKLKALYEEFHDQGFEIIGVAADEKEDLEKFLVKRPLPWQQIVDADGKLGERLGIQAFPTLLLVDREGKNVKNFVGESSGLKTLIGLLLEGKSLEEVVEKADSETPVSNEEQN